MNIPNTNALDVGTCTKCNKHICTIYVSNKLYMIFNIYI